MADLVTIEGQQYRRRNPLGVLGLSIITLGIYFFVWYFKINDELRRAENDPTISPTRSLMAVSLGWLIVVPPFIAMYNTAKHVQAMESRRGVMQTLEPALTDMVQVPGQRIWLVESDTCPSPVTVTVTGKKSGAFRFAAPFLR